MYLYKLGMVLFVCLMSAKIQAAWWHSFWPFGGAQTPEEQYRALLARQVQNPDAPDINYNLGVVQYERKEFGQALASFNRALQSPTLPEVLRKRALFNAGKSSYQAAVALLPKDWEKPETEIKDEVCSKALPLAQESCQHFKHMTELGFTEQRVQDNLVRAQELVKRLQKQQEQNKQQQDKNDTQQQNDKNNKDNKNDQSKEHQQQKNDSQQDGEKSDNSDKKEQQNKDQSKNSEQNQQQDSTDQQQKQDTEQDKNKQEQEEQQDEQGQQQGVDQKDNQNKKEQEQHGGADEQQQTGQEQQQGGAGEEQKNEKQQQALRMLDYVAQDEKNIQKMMLQQKTKQQKPPESSGQKSW